LKQQKIHLVTLVFLCVISVINAQEVNISGKVIANDDVEGIHIINKTAGKFSITNSYGQFQIPAKPNDTILISGLKYVNEEIVVNDIIYKSRIIEVYLKENINQLNEVIVGKILTGDLLTDIENANLKRDINFYDLGIPGYTGKPKTQTERRLYEADAGKFFVFYGVGFAINVHKILNRISGRTRTLKNHVRLETLDVCMNRAKSEFSEILFAELEIEEHLIMEFFYYVSEDANFMELCKRDNNMEMYEFLVHKLTHYKNNQEAEED
jgi:hypothetical protein